MDFAAAYLEDARRMARFYKGLAESAMKQVGDDDFFAALGEEDNSIAVVARHMAGNLRSRWTDFLTTDGEKPDRDRDGEFVARGQTRESVAAAWEAGWRALLEALDALRPDDLARTVYIRGEPHGVIQAVDRALLHAAYHVGQIVLLAKHAAGPAWQTLSIARNRSAESGAP
ncbi:MAG: DUF1572 domain-containing protein [Gemmatimonadetes bacterium]|nr:DUF1572 domain-containing protein [Gemmatimonadota bacterium]